jgi:uncharacterized protein
MEMQGQRQLAVKQQEAWEALNDPTVLKQCVPGCDKLELMEDGRYAVGMSLKIGPVSAKFTGKIEMSNVNAPESYTLGFDGQGGVAGFGKGVSHVKLTPNDSGTLLDYSVKAQVGGKIAQLGQRLIDGVAKSMADDFFARFDGVLQERFAPPQATTAHATIDAPEVSTGEVAPSVAKKPQISVPISVWAMLLVGVFIIVYFITKR